MMEMETSVVVPTPTLTTRDDVDMDVDANDFVDDDEMEATQLLDEDEPEEVVANDTPTKPTKPTVDTTAPTTDGSFDVVGASASAKPFAAAFGTVWQVLQSLGWQTAQGPGTEFVSMPGTQFFNFRPNINVFDAKGKACWKWLALAAKQEKENAAEATVWETLWTIAESQFGWYTMSSGNETWFVKPNTSFTEFQPNVTIFQTKKRAVLQTLAVNKVKIDLGDSVEGKQVLDFAAKPEAATPKAKAKKEKASESKSDSFTTPPPKKNAAASAAASSSNKSKATPTNSTKKSNKTTPAKKTGKSPKTSKGGKKQEDDSLGKSRKQETPLQFHVPEFKCTFAHVYKQLQMRGWHHKPGSFEYDYFSPDYTKETQILNGNYFQSAAEFEGFLKDSGMWADIEAGLRDEHAALVEELREEAEEKRRKQRARSAAKEAADKAKPTPPKEAAKSPRSPLKKKKSAFKASMEASMAAVAAAATPSPGTKRDAAGAVKISMGKVVEKLVKRGWYYRPGRFEYDYFKPNVTSKKNAIPGEDFFQSLSELEEYLKTSDLWDDLAQEIRNDADKDDDAESEDDNDKKDAKAKQAASPAKKQRIESQPRAKSPLRTEPSGPLMQAAAALSSDIWGNSHQIDFEKY